MYHDKERRTVCLDAGGKLISGSSQHIPASHSDDKANLDAATEYARKVAELAAKGSCMNMGCSGRSRDGTCDAEAVCVREGPNMRSTGVRIEVAA